MNAALLTEEQNEALQEIANIGMGRAGRSIAGVFDEFVELSVPRVREARLDSLTEAVAGLIPEETLTAVRQGFFGRVRGEVIVVFGMNGCRDLAGLMGYGDSLVAADEDELLLDVANVIVSACLGGIAEQLSTELSVSAPSVLASHVPPAGLFGATREAPDGSGALIVEVNFRLERHSFACSLLMMLPADGVGAIRQALDDFLASF
ncbi:hypothetical protein [Methyloversatilis thermotolerans]|uniref:hypothetical protein n=1 Tax=Methyloversatilis thermotolerans TaxID=1346290 RepID=UPI0003626249|nr:hypothetical protein [Methyloversatilis thermotolerans]